MQLIRLGADQAYRILNDVLGEVMDVRMYPDSTKREFINQKLEEIEKKINQAMNWIYGIKEL